MERRREKLWVLLLNCLTIIICFFPLPKVWGEGKIRDYAHVFGATFRADTQRAEMLEAGQEATKIKVLRRGWVAADGRVGSGGGGRKRRRRRALAGRRRALASSKKKNFPALIVCLNACKKSCKRLLECNLIILYLFYFKTQWRNCLKEKTDKNVIIKFSEVYIIIIVTDAKTVWIF